MFDLPTIKGIIFDYGGTIDSNGMHWGEVLWSAYQNNRIGVSKEQFREAYVYAERYLAANLVILPEDNFLVLLQKKLTLHRQYLLNQAYIDTDQYPDFVNDLSQECYQFSKQLIDGEKEILQQLKAKYPIVLVSNFYGNIQSVLTDFGLDTIFETIIESSVVGIRKPDPAIFGLGVEAMGIPAENIVVIGDSYKKDIVPAHKTGCATIWLKSIGWEPDPEEATADRIISDFQELNNVFSI